MKDVSIGLEAMAVGLLQFAQFIRLRVMRIDREALINKEVPNFLALGPGIEGFVLRVTDAAKFLIRSRRLGAITLANELNDAFALIDLFTEHSAQIAALGAENVLPDWLVAEKGQSIYNQLPGAMKLTTDGGNKD